MKHRMRISLVLAALSLAKAYAQPPIYLTPLETPGLENPGNNDQWSAVRNNLHGLWFNNAGNSNEEARDIILNLNRDVYPIIVPVSYNYTTPLDYQYPAWTKYEQINGLLNGVKELQPTVYLFDSLKIADGEYDLQEAIDAIHAMQADPKFSNTLSGVTFSPRHGLDDTPSLVTNQTYFHRSKALIDEIDGMVAVESAPWRMTGLPRAREGFVNLYNYAKTNNLEFTWLMNRGVGTDNDQWIAQIENALDQLALENCYPDVLAISNQGDNSVPKLPALAEADTSGVASNSITGALYWLLGEYGWLSPPMASSQSIVAPYEGSTIVVLYSTGTNLTYAIQNPPMVGSLGALDPVTGAVMYTTLPGTSGADHFTFTSFDGSLYSTGTVNITVLAEPTVLKLQTGTVADTLMDPYLDYASTTIDETKATGFFLYDVSSQGVGGPATILKLDVVSDTGRTVRFGGLNGIAVAGGANIGWWDSDEDLTITLSLLDAASNDVTSAYAVDLSGAALRWDGDNSSAAVFNSETVSATTSGSAFEELSLASGQTTETLLNASRNNDTSLSQLAGLVYGITLLPILEPSAAYLQISHGAGFIHIAASNLTPTAMNTLQSRGSLTSGVWSNLFMATGVVETNWVLSVTTQEFYQVESLY